MDSLDILSEYLDSRLFHKNVQLFVQANFSFTAKKSEADQYVLIHKMCECFPREICSLQVSEKLTLWDQSYTLAKTKCELIKMYT